MNERFREFVETLHPSFERLLSMAPVSAAAIPKHASMSCIYLFSEGDKHLYVGRTRNLRRRMGQHTRPSAQHNQAAFAFRLARNECGQTTATYAKGEGRATLASDPAFASAFIAAKARIRNMDLRFVAEDDPTRQALLEIYVSVALQTRYNDFDTH